eukprot:3721645-Pleurochrysis_carterae.AAC.1
MAGAQLGARRRRRRTRAWYSEQWCAQATTARTRDARTANAARAVARAGDDGTSARHSRAEFAARADAR